MAWEDERCRAEEFGPDQAQPLTDQEADAAQDWRGTPELSRSKWTLRLWFCAGCRRHFIRTGWWNQYHKAGDLLTREVSSHDDADYQAQPWCSVLALELHEGPVYAAWLIGGPDAVAAMVAR